MNGGRGIEIAGRVLRSFVRGHGSRPTSGYDSIWTNKDTAYLLYVLDTTTGAFKFEKPFEVKGRMLGTELKPQGLIYVTTRHQHSRSRYRRLAQRARGLPAKPGSRSRPRATARSSTRSTRATVSCIASTARRALKRSFDRAPLRSSTTTAHERWSPSTTRSCYGREDCPPPFPGRRQRRHFNEHYRAPRDPAWMRGLAWAEGVHVGMASVSAGHTAPRSRARPVMRRRAARAERSRRSCREGFGDLSDGYRGLAGDYVGSPAAATRPPRSRATSCS